MVERNRSDWNIGTFFRHHCLLFIAKDKNRIHLKK